VATDILIAFCNSSEEDSLYTTIRRNNPVGIYKNGFLRKRKKKIIAKKILLKTLPNYLYSRLKFHLKK